MANKPGTADFFPEVPSYPSMGTFQPMYGKFDLTTYIQGASDYEIMAFLVGKYNACLEAYDKVTKLSTDTITAAHQLQDWINTWFDNLDVQQELNNKIDSMVADGSFETLLHQTFDTQINQQTTNAVTAWLVANVTPTGSAVVVDKSLSIEGAAADAKAVGDTTWRMKNISYVDTSKGTVDLNTIPVNTQVTFSYPKNMISHLPESPALDGDYFLGSVITFTGNTSNTLPAAGTIQLLFLRTATSTVFARFTWSYPVEWAEWECIGGFSGSGKSFIYNSGDSAISLNKLKTNESYVFSYPADLITGLPDELSKSGGTCLFTLQTFNFSNKQGTNAPIDGALQMLTSAFNNNLWVRTVMGGSGQWLPWHSVGGFGDGQEYQNYDNPSKTLDLNKLPFNQVCTLATNYAYLTNAPTDLAGLDVNGTILTFNKYNAKPVGADADGGSVQILYTFTTPNVIYIRVGWSYPATWLDWHTIGAYSPTTTTVGNQYAFSGLNDFAACGDSITVSLSYPTPDTGITVQSWAKILAKLNGTNCNVFAQGGMDTQHFLTSDLYTNAIADKSQFAILFLGINDINNSIPVGSASDIGTTNNTFYANYTRIINGLLTNHKFVFCISIPAALQHNIDPFNNAIKDICLNHTEKAFYADISDWSDSIGQFGSGHLSSVGYGELAGAIQNAIGNAMAANSYFRILDA